MHRVGYALNIKPTWQSKIILRILKKNSYIFRCSIWRMYFMKKTVWIKKKINTKIMSLNCTHHWIFFKNFHHMAYMYLHNEHLKCINVHEIETLHIPRSMFHNVGLSRSDSISVIWGLKKDPTYIVSFCKGTCYWK